MLIRPAISGRCTLITTCSPLCRVAACTCPREAAANGRRSKWAKSWSIGRPRLSSIVAMATSDGKEGTVSWSFPNSLTNSAGRRSGRVLRAWPSLTKVGPRAISASRRRPAVPRGVGGGTRSTRRRGSERSETSPSWSTRAPKPWPTRTWAISR